MVGIKISYNAYPETKLKVGEVKSYDHLDILELDNGDKIHFEDVVFVHLQKRWGIFTKRLIAVKTGQRQRECILVTERNQQRLINLRVRDSHFSNTELYFGVREQNCIYYESSTRRSRSFSQS